MIKWAWENVGAPGIYFGEDESESSSGEEPGPSSRGKGKRKASGPPNLQPSAKRVHTEEEEGDEESDGSEYFLVSMKPFGALESFVCEYKACTVHLYLLLSTPHIHTF